VTSEPERDLETIHGTGVGTTAGKTLQVSVSGLQYDFDNMQTSLICDEPVGGELTLTGTTSATLSFGYPSPGCGFAGLEMSQGGPTRVSVDERTHSDDAADLVIGVEQNPLPAFVGENLTYTLTVFNAGVDADRVFLTDSLPSNVRWISTIASQGTCAGSLTVTCDLGHLPRFSHAVVTIVGTPTTEGWIVNTAGITSGVGDTDPSNNTFVSGSLVVGTGEPVPSQSGVDLLLNVSADPSPVFAGQNVTYTLNVSNQGTTAATGVVVLDTVQYGAQWASSSTGQGSCSGNAPVTCSLGGLDPGASATITIVVTTDSSSYYGATLYNSASVTSTVQDDAPQNNTVNLNVNILTPVQTPARIEITPSSAVTVGTGSTKQFSAISYDANNYPTYYPALSWQSSDETVVSVTSGGVANALRVGTATITASSGGTESNAVTITVEDARMIALPSNDLVYDPYSQRLYASVSSRAGDIGNTVTAIDPATGTIEWSLFVGSEPGRLALSDDGHWLYVALDGATGIQRVDLPNHALDIQFSLGSDASNGTYRVGDMEVLPGQPDSVAVSRVSATSTWSLGVAVYDNGVQRPTTSTTNTYAASNAITFSDTASTLYAFGINLLQTLSVDNSGVTVSANSNNGMSFYGADFEFDGGRLYFSTGQVIDPATTSLLGTFTLSDSTFSYYSPLSFAPDSASGRTYFLFASGNSRLVRTYDQTTFRPVDVLEVQNVSLSSYSSANQIGSLRRWGGDGLAFRADGDRIMLFRTALVP
jgi:uncharacterized repeat protein (TIGR01451 family)